jgi:DNA-binding CsgD family transcriptional regulator
MHCNGHESLRTTPRPNRVTEVVTEADWQAVIDRLNLSDRQMQVVRHLFDDESEARIAMRLRISPHTVHTYLKQVYAKLGVNSRAELLVHVFAAVLASREASRAAHRA